jgi:hypothetical protein
MPRQPPEQKREFSEEFIIFMLEFYNQSPKDLEDWSDYRIHIFKQRMYNYLAPTLWADGWYIAFAQVIVYVPEIYLISRVSIGYSLASRKMLTCKGDVWGNGR